MPYRERSHTHTQSLTSHPSSKPSYQNSKKPANLDLTHKSQIYPIQGAQSRQNKTYGQIVISGKEILDKTQNLNLKSDFRLNRDTNYGGSECTAVKNYRRDTNGYMGSIAIAHTSPSNQMMKSAVLGDSVVVRSVSPAKSLKDMINNDYLNNGFLNRRLQGKDDRKLGHNTDIENAISALLKRPRVSGGEPNVFQSKKNEKNEKNNRSSKTVKSRPENPENSPEKNCSNNSKTNFIIENKVLESNLVAFNARLNDLDQKLSSLDGDPASTNEYSKLVKEKETAKSHAFSTVLGSVQRN
jgi:hypothetical protein